MRSYFLEAARQGHNQFSKYLITLGLLVVSVFAGTAVGLLGGILYLQELPNPDAIELFLEVPSVFLFVSGWVWFSILIAILWSEEKIHRRSARGLLSVDGTVRLRRLGLAVLVWFGLRAISTLVLYITAPTAYRWRGTIQEWLAFSPFILFICLLMAIALLVFICYVMRGASLILSRPRVLIGGLALGIGMLVAIGQDTAPMLVFLQNVFFVFFILFLVFKEECIELSVGLVAADYFYNFMFVVNETSPLPALFDVDIELTSRTLSLVLLVVRLGSFYYWFRGQSQHLQRFF
ncbi:MAG: hypothetical protein AAFX01_11070 [Cyanobacteria bacterium J06638_28]